MLALALCFSLATTTEDYNAVRQNGNNAGLFVLGAWALASTATGVTGLLLADDPPWKGAHLGNLVWGLINLGFSVIPLVLAFMPGATRTSREDALADGRSTQFVYAWNAGLDVGYLAASALGLREFSDARVKGFMKASLVQALFLLVFDGTMAMFHALNNDRIR